MKKNYLILGIILVVGALLRLYHNTDISLWHDEAFSALLIKYPWGEMFYRIGLDVHPPAYYIALRLWHYVLGDSLLSLRGFSIFFGLGTAVAAYGFVNVAFKSTKAALIAALLIAINPFQLQYATEARMYTFGAFLAILAAYFLVQALEIGSNKELVISNKKEGRARALPSVLYYIAFGITAGIAALTHYYLLFTIAALCFYALIWHIYYYRQAFKKYLLLITSYLLLVLVFAPWTKWFLYQYKQVGAGYWIPPMDKWSIPTTLWEMFLRFPFNIGQFQDQLLIVVAVIFLVGVFIYFLWKATSAAKWLVVLAFIAPFAGSILFLLLAKLKGENSSVYLVRYFLYASTFLSIALAVWLTNLKRTWVTYLLFTVYAIANIWSFHTYWHNLDVKTKPGMAGAIKYLQMHVSPADKLYVGTSFEFFNLKYYLSQTTPPIGPLLQTTMRSKSFSLEDLSEEQPAASSNPQAVQSWPKPLLFTGGNEHVSNMPHFAGTAILTDQDLLPRFDAQVASGDTVWLLWTNGFGSNKPPVPPNWTQVDEAGFAEVRPYVGTWVVVTKYSVN